MKIEIKSRYDGAVLFALEIGSLKLAVEAAVASGANLSGANLSGANLSGANLSGADLYGYISIGPIGSRNAYLWARWQDGKYIVHTGCFSGTLDKFKKAVKKTHSEGIHRREYLAAIELLSERMKSSEGDAKKKAEARHD